MCMLIYCSTVLPGHDTSSMVWTAARKSSSGIGRPQVVDVYVGGGVGVPFYRVPSNVLSVLVQVAAATEALEVTIMTKLDEAKASGNAQGAITLEGLKATLEEMFAAAKAEVRIAAFAALCWSDT